MKDLLKRVSAVMIAVAVCVGCAVPALAGHTHHLVLQWANMKDEDTHIAHYACDYDLCDYTVDYQEPHVYRPVRMLYERRVVQECKFCRYQRELVVTSENWLATIPDNALITQINLPGSFQSGTRYCYLSSSPKLQDEGIPDQIKNGVRILHLELDDHNDNWPDYNVTYYRRNLSTGNKSGSHWEELYFSDVARYVSKALEDNPSETFVILVRSDNGNSGVKNTLMKGLARDRDHGTGVWSRFDAYRPGDPVPTLGEVRGKCVVLCLDEDSYTNYSEYQSRMGYAQYNNFIEAQMDVVMQPYFNGQQNYDLKKDTFRKENLYYLSNAGNPSVKIAAYDATMKTRSNLGTDRLNLNTSETLRAIISKIDYAANRGCRLGWVMMMKAGKELCKSVIDSNLRAGEKAEPLPEDESTEPVDFGFPLTSWMAYMPDNAPISQLNLPGTHDSGTRYMRNDLVEHCGRCQEKSIYEQLNAGLRTLDIRLGIVDKDKGTSWDYMRINHNGYICFPDSDHTRWLVVRDVLDMVQKFLKENRSETVVMLVVQDEEKNTTNGHIREMKAALNKDRKNRSGERWPDIDFYTVGDRIPKLGEVRGKCVIIWDAEEEIGPSGKNERPRADYSDKYFLPADVKLQWISMAMDNYHLKEMQDYTRNDVFSDPGNLKCPYRPGDPPVRYVGYNANMLEQMELVDGGPKDLFEKMKPTLEKIKPRTGKRVGWVAMDFPTETMVRNIINSNRIFNLYYEADVHIPEEFAEAAVAFSMGTLVYWKDDGSGVGYVVETLDLSDDIQSILDDDFTVNLDFRAYDADATDPDRHYGIVFPNGARYEITREIVVDELVTPVNKSGRIVAAKASNDPDEQKIRHIREDIEITGRIKPPKTGDSANPVLWIITLILSAAALIAIGKGKKLI